MRCLSKRATGSAQKETSFAKATFCQGVSHPRQDFLRHLANVSRRNTGTAQGLSGFEGSHITPSLVGLGGVSGGTCPQGVQTESTLAHATGHTRRPARIIHTTPSRRQGQNEEEEA